MKQSGRFWTRWETALALAGEHNSRPERRNGQMLKLTPRYGVGGSKVLKMKRAGRFLGGQLRTNAFLAGCAPKVRMTAKRCFRLDLGFVSSTPIEVFGLVGGTLKNVVLLASALPREIPKQPDEFLCTCYSCSGWTFTVPVIAPRNLPKGPRAHTSLHPVKNLSGLAPDPGRCR